MEAYAGRRALVLGASGFIGRWVVRYLANAGAEVRPGVRFGSGTSPAGAGNGEEVVADLAIPGAATALVRRLRPDIVFNLAGYGVDPAERDPLLAARTNGVLVEELAGACAALPDNGWPGQRLVHAGSALEYGTVRGDLDEDTEPAPTTLYGRTKLAGTRALLRANREHGLRGVAARLFMVYGPGERPGRLLPSLLRAKRDGASLALTSGRQRRDFTYVEDVAEGMLRLGLCPGTGLGVVNLATGLLVTVREFAERAARVIGLPTERLRFGELPDRPEEMAHDPVSIGRLRALCRWQPAVTIEEGVARTRDAE